MLFLCWLFVFLLAQWEGLFYIDNFCGVKDVVHIIVVLLVDATPEDAAEDNIENGAEKPEQWKPIKERITELLQKMRIQRGSENKKALDDTLAPEFEKVSLILFHPSLYLHKLSLLSLSLKRSLFLSLFSHYLLLSLSFFIKYFWR